MKYITNKKIPVKIADSTKKKIILSDLDDEVAVSLASTVLNKKWIKDLLLHDKHGGQKISDRLEYMMGFNALTNSLPESYWDLCYQTYIENEQIRQRLKENNKYAMLETIKTFLEAVQRKFWNASEEQIKSLKELYLSIENEIESE
ncbi:MAG: cobaltochelatase subunit CobN [Promethearchaeota archaeon]